MFGRSLRLCFVLAMIFSVVSLASALVLAEITLHPGHRRVLRPPRDFTISITRMARAGFQDVQVEAADKTPLRGWFVQPDAWNGETVVMLHGLGDNRDGMLGYAFPFLKARYAVLLPDSRAHGESGGVIATYGVIERDDVSAWTRWLRKRSEGCIYLFGESMGAAIALQAAETTSGICALAVESPFSSLREIAYDRMSQFTGLRLGTVKVIGRPTLEMALLYTRLRYRVSLSDARPRDALAATSIPCLIVVDDADHNIPPRHAALLLASATPQDSFWHVPDADHGGAVRVAHAEFEKRLLDWFESHTALQE